MWFFSPQRNVVGHSRDAKNHLFFPFIFNCVEEMST